MMLIVPGRVGTSSPELGVPTAFSDISTFSVVCEVEETKAGYNPELSYGSHIFQDLVEAEIFYTAVFHNEKVIQYAPERLEKFRNIVSKFEDGNELSDVVKVYTIEHNESHIYHNIENEEMMITI